MCATLKKRYRKLRLLFLEKFFCLWIFTQQQFSKWMMKGKEISDDDKKRCMLHHGRLVTQTILQRESKMRRALFLSLGHRSEGEVRESRLLTSAEAKVVSVGKSFVEFVVVFSFAKTKIVRTSLAQSKAVGFWWSFGL